MAFPITKLCAECGAPAEDYEWEPGTYWCDYHAKLDRVGAQCMVCEARLDSVDAADDWYFDNGGQLCPEHARD